MTAAIESARAEYDTARKEAARVLALVCAELGTDHTKLSADPRECPETPSRDAWITACQRLGEAIWQLTKLGANF